MNIVFDARKPQIFVYQILVYFEVYKNTNIWRPLFASICVFGNKHLTQVLFQKHMRTHDEEENISVGILKYVS